MIKLQLLYMYNCEHHKVALPSEFDVDQSSVEVDSSRLLVTSSSQQEGDTEVTQGLLRGHMTQETSTPESSVIVGRIKMYGGAEVMKSWCMLALVR